MYTVLFFCLAALIAVSTVILRSYNAMRNQLEILKESLSNISVVTGKKISLVNQLIAIVQSYQESEKFVMLQVSADTVQGAQEASARSGSIIADISRTAQKFPDLKANQQYNRFMDALQVAEQDVQNARLTYNRQARMYNTSRSSVPTILYANVLGFSEAQYLSKATAEDPAMKVQRTITSDDSHRVNTLLEQASKREVGGTKQLGQLDTPAESKAITSVTEPVFPYASNEDGQTRHCPQCGARKDGGNFCGDCGTKL